MTHRTCYLVLATPRSGSTLLGQGLQATGLAGDPKEFFGHKMAFWMERWGTPQFPMYVDRLIRERSTPNGVFGAKLLYGQLRQLEDVVGQDQTVVAGSLSEALRRFFPDLHLIWATREDKTRQAISWYKARQTGIWGQDAGRDSVKLGRAWRLGDEPLQPGELAFDFDGIAALRRQAEEEDAAIGRFLAASGFPSFRVVYEQFSPRYEETLRDLVDWLGIVAPAGLAIAKPRTAKLANDRTEEWVVRFEQLRAASR